MIPLISYFQRDFIPVMLVADEEGTVNDMAAACAAEAVGRRVPPQDRPLQVECNGAVLDGTMKVTDAGVGPLDVVYVGYV